MAVHIVHFNINGLRSNKPLLVQYMNEHKPDIICINETKLDQNSKISFTGHKMIRRDRNARGGGVAILIRKEMEFKIIETNEIEAEILGIELNVNQSKTAIVAIYNPPGVTPDKNTFKKITEKYKNCLFVGDFNSKHPYFGCKRSNDNGHVLFDISEDLDLTILNNPDEDTHMAYTGNTDILDMAFSSVNLTPRIEECYVGEDICNDHLPLHIKLSRDDQMHLAPTKLRRNLNKLT